MRGQLASHALLPFFLDPRDVHEQEISLSQHVADYLNTMSGSSVRAEQVDDLLCHKRLLIIVDHYSELTDDQRRRIFSNLPLKSLVLLTSRLKDYGDAFYKRGWTVTVIEPQKLKEKELFHFFQRYLERRGAEAGGDDSKPLLTPDDYTSTRELLERMVGNQPITVLLAWMVIEKAIQHISARQANAEAGVSELLPSSVPELMEDYVRSSGRAIADADRWLKADPEQEPELILVVLKALALEAHRQGNLYQPSDFSESLAHRAWATVNVAGKPLALSDHKRLFRYLKDRLTLLIPSGRDTFRISLDPLADYLAALAQRESWEQGRDRVAHRQEVERWLHELRGRREWAETEDEGQPDRLAGMRGFLAACRDCYRQWLSRCDERLDPEERKTWQQLLDRFAREAKIDKAEERILSAKHLIRRHAKDLEWANPELRAKAIAELTAYAREFKPTRQREAPAREIARVSELEGAIGALQLTMAKPTYPAADRAAAAEALGHIGGPRAAEALIDFLLPAEEPAPALAERAGDPSEREEVRRAAAAALGLVEASPEDPEAHWRLLRELLADGARHLQAETDQERIDAKLPLLQGASRGLQRLAARSSPFPLPVWGAGPGLKVPMLSLTTAAGAVTTRLVDDVEVWQLPLPGELPLEVVMIPANTYTIGSPSSEEGREVYDARFQVKAEEVERVEAQRQVTVPSFAMARYPLTQAQWRCLAGADHQRQGERALNPDPAKDKGEELPVETVSWWDVSAWCHRLQRHLRATLGERAPRVGLPSESLWEVACRATTGTPFHFGDTLDGAWANYDATTVYPPGKEGRFHNKITPVGAYGFVNAFGLADLHGNVWEWCADLWHPDSLGAPPDGSPRTDPAVGLTEARLLRGGSWFIDPRNCRSASRSRASPGGLSGLVGFRVCCLPPGLPSWPSSP
ncbi:MAG: SUMF1/EgtB/PvdO family nonheme iron enzyme [Cyanobacteriota bacterium]|nr:SUMF1/EgtB/PvdO family nonheme iron enzyme [Cyanobacteriota bacterium]